MFETLSRITITVQPVGGTSVKFSTALKAGVPEKIGAASTRVEWEAVATEPRLVLATGGTLQDLQGGVTVYVGDAAPDGGERRADGREAWGHLLYFATSFNEFFQVGIAVSQSLFDRVAALAQNGSIPELSIQVGLHPGKVAYDAKPEDAEGLRFDSEWIWDNEGKVKALNIHSCELDWKFGASSQGESITGSSASTLPIGPGSVGSPMKPSTMWLLGLLLWIAPYVIVAWGYTSFIHGGSGAFGAAMAVLLIAWVFFGVIRWLGGIVGWRILLRDAVRNSTLNWLRKNGFPTSRAGSGTDFDEYLLRIEESSRSEHSDVLRKCAADTRLVMETVQSVDRFLAKRLRSAQNVALDIYASQ